MSKFIHIGTVQVHRPEPFLYLHTPPVLFFAILEPGNIFAKVEILVSSRSQRGDVCINGNPGQVALRDITCGAYYEEIEALACFSFTNIRNASKLGMLPLVSIFSGLEAISLGPVAGEVACDPNSTFVAQMNGGNLEVAWSHFARQDLPEAALDSKISSKLI